ncbi:MAG TPA: ATP-binding protein, partial [Acidimicrobiales bacterium]|nr:ATP-binding protein [Acidimicrobiales bacterium]
MALLGRDRECEQLDELVRGAASRRGGSLVVRGDVGIGKTTLLDRAAASALSSRSLVVRAAGVESEMELAYAVVHQICARFLGCLGELPSAQAEALSIALGERSGDPPDRFLVGVSLLGLLARAASARPLVCVVDDAQWIDESSLLALAFAARRVAAEPVVVLFATRTRLPVLAGVPEIALSGLEEPDARALLATIVRGRLDQRVRDRIVDETRGNPLALIELPRGRDAAELAGGFGVPASAGLSGFVEERFLQRVRQLPAASQLLLLLAAAEPLGDPSLLLAAASRLRIGVDDAAPAESSGLLQIGARVAFSHPLVRSAIYRSATTDDRLRVHRALAEVTDAVSDPERRAWHRALSSIGKDDEIAGELVTCAGRAQARGGPAAAAAFLEMAASFVSEPAHRALLMLSSAEEKYEAGALLAAAELLGAVDVACLPEERRPHLERLGAQLRLNTDRGPEPALALMRAARGFESSGSRSPSGSAPSTVSASTSASTLARRSYLDAMSVAMIIGPSRLGEQWVELARAVRAGSPPAGPAAGSPPAGPAPGSPPAGPAPGSPPAGPVAVAGRPPAPAAPGDPLPLAALPLPPRPVGPASELLLDGIATQVLDGYRAALPALRASLELFLRDEVSSAEEVDVLWLACRTAMNLWEDRLWRDLAALQMRVARDSGRLPHLQSAISANVAVALLGGDSERAAALNGESAALAETTGSAQPAYGPLALAAWQGAGTPWPPSEALSGLEPDPGAAVASSAHDTAARMTILNYALALGWNGRGHYEEALAAAARAARSAPDLGFAMWALPELVEAGCRCGAESLAHAALGQLRETTQASATDWGLGIEACCAALLHEGAGTEELYVESVERLAKTGFVTQLARARLVYGEWLRRENRRIDAREQLRAARQVFVAMGAEGFAARAERELAATGERARRRGAGPAIELTPQEAQIGRM